MEIFRNISIRAKLLLLILLLVVPLIYFVSVSIYNLIEQQRDLQAATMMLNESDLLTNVLHEVQSERALTNAYILSNRATFIRRLEAQYPRTNNAIAAYENYSRENNLRASVINQLSHLQFIRRDMEQERIKLDEVNDFYAKVEDQLIDQVKTNHTAYRIYNLEREIGTHNVFLEAKRSIGMMRTFVVKDFPGGNIPPVDLAYFSGLEYNLNQYSRDFRRYASPEILEFYGKHVNHPALEKFSIIVDSITTTGSLAGLNMTPDERFSVFTETIGIVKEIEDFVIEQIHNTLERQTREMSQMVVAYIALVFFLLILTATFSYYIINIIAGSIEKLKNAANSISRGDNRVKIDIKSKDEIGELADAFREVVRRNTIISHAADRIGSGDYNVEIDIENEEDILSISLNDMRNNLKKISHAEMQKTWMLEGNSDLNDIMRNEQEVNSLMKNVVAFLCEYLYCQAGIAFVSADDGKYYARSGYGFNPDNLNGNSVVVPGEGIIGEAIISKKLKVLDDVKASTIKIKTSFVESQPVSIVIMPLVHADEVLGVIELASKEEIEPQKIKFLQTNAEKIAVILKSLKTDEKTAELLYETQSQAEELEAQQEELRQANEELKTQRSRLQASEEELRINQEELQEKNSELEEKANELEEQYELLRLKNTELEDAKHALQLKMEQLEVISKYKSEFLANMSHELRTPLNSVLILAKILSENRHGNLTEKQIEHAKIIERSGNDLLKLINEILDLAKVEAGKINLEPKKVKLKTLFAGTQFKSIAESKEIEFNIIREDDIPPVIETDDFRLNQVLGNLLSNAFKFTPEKGKIEVRMHRPAKGTRFMNENLDKDDNIIAFSVSDTGIGIPQDKLKIIFEAFQQADTSTTRKYGGTGLGLSISRELANILGGEIHVESTLGKGSTFTLYLPANFPSSDEYKENKNQEVMPRLPVETLSFPGNKIVNKDIIPENGRREILIIEDDENFVKILSDFAEARNFTPVIATNGKQGFEKALSGNPQAILLDIKLPDVNGWELLQKFKSHPRLKDVPVHIMSAYDKEGHLADLGQESFMSKPIAHDTLEEAFKSLSNKKFYINKLLIVEDNQIENNSIAELLQSHELKADQAFDGVEALKCINENSYDVIILDLNLPDINGFELIEKIKKLNKYLDVPVIIYSGKELSKDEEKRLQKYTNTIIIKTAYSYTRLLEEIKLFLHRIQNKTPKEISQTVNVYRTEESLKDKKVLVVDDDVRNLYSLSNVFEDQGVNTIVAYDGKQALKELEENPDIDIVLMDVMMPEMDGLEATRRIREMPQYKNLPIISLTAKAMKGDREKCIQAGANDYISKPVDVDKLLSLMRVWLYEK